MYLILRLELPRTIKNSARQRRSLLQFTIALTANLQLIIAPVIQPAPLLGVLAIVFMQTNARTLILKSLHPRVVYWH